MLCIGGSQIPFGWSFLSIAKVPMTWSDGDIWTAEARALLEVFVSDIVVLHLTTLMPGPAQVADCGHVLAGRTACQHEGRV